MKVINRIKKYNEFQKVIHEGAFVNVESFNAYFLKNDINLSRFGISIPKKCGNAVVRNRIKRQIRAAIAEKCDYSLPYDIVLIARSTYKISDFKQTASDIEEIIKKVG